MTKSQKSIQLKIALIDSLCPFTGDTLNIYITLATNLTQTKVKLTKKMTNSSNRGSFDVKIYLSI